MKLFGDLVVDLEKGDDLKMLFDGGLRPWRVPGLERSHLFLEPGDIVLHLTPDQSFRIPIVRGNVTVLEGHKLMACEFFGKITSVAEAAALTKTICRSLGKPVTGLDQLLANLGTRSDPSKYWVAPEILQGNTDLHVAFQPLYNIDSVTASVYVSVTWKRSVSEMQIPSEPIKPPKGYEGVSMDAPKPDPNAKPFPEHGPEYYRDLIVQAKLKDRQRETPGTAPEVAPKTPTAATPPVTLPSPSTTEARTSMWPWILGILVLTLVGFLVWKLRSS